MPMITLTTAASVTPQAAQQLTEGLGKAITLIPGKSKSHLMLSFQGGVAMSFGGKASNAAFVSVNCFGHAPKEAYEKLTAAICELLQTVLEISPENVFIKYSETENWGWNGYNL